MNVPARPRRAAAVVVVVAAALLGSASHAGAQTAVAVRAAVVRDGWWSSSGLPLPTVPDDGVAVAAASGEPERLAAYAIDLDVPAGATVSRLELAAPEIDPASSATADVAAIVACPATATWQAVKGGAWAARPAFDCTLAEGAGFRGADGVWAFDLTPIAQLWAADLPNRGVVLVEAAAAPGTFNASLAGAASGLVKVRAAAVAGDAPATSRNEPSPSGSFGSSDGTVVAGDGELAREPDLTVAPAATTPTSGAPSADDAAEVDEPTELDDEVAAPAPRSKAGDLTGGFELAWALGLLAVVLGAIAVAVATSAATDPTHRRRRAGGVSRVLDARRADRQETP